MNWKPNYLECGIVENQNGEYRVKTVEDKMKRSNDTFNWRSREKKWRIIIWDDSFTCFQILQARLQQYMNCEPPDVQAGFRKGRGIRGQIANIRWIIEKAREFQKNIYFCFIDYAKAFDCVDHNKLWKMKSSRDGNTRPPDLPLEKPVCRSGSNS